METLELADGRQLTYDTYGDPDGLPVVFSHGFADSRLIRWAYRSDVAKAKKELGTYVEAVAEGDPSDAPTFLDDPAQKDMFEANFEAGMAQDEEGLYEMTMALWNWGFEIEDVHQHFDVFYGDADDIISPEMPERVAVRLPDATPHVWPGAGHYGFVDRDRWTSYLGALTARG